MPDEDFKRLPVNMLTGHIDTNKTNSIQGLKEKTENKGGGVEKNNNVDKKVSTEIEIWKQQKLWKCKIQ